MFRVPGSRFPPSHSRASDRLPCQHLGLQLTDSAPLLFETCFRHVTPRPRRSPSESRRMLFGVPSRYKHGRVLENVPKQLRPQATTRSRAQRRAPTLGRHAQPR
eukprot:1185815-Prorocentrum_minimum.AAC.1